MREISFKCPDIGLDVSATVFTADIFDIFNNLIYVAFSKRQKLLPAIKTMEFSNFKRAQRKIK